MSPALDQIEITQGAPRPLGATLQPDGAVNFAVFAKYCDAVDLVLFDREDPEKETARVRLTERTGRVWHAAVHGIKPGQLYGYRVHGPWEPQAGHLFNPSKLLLDPYARGVHSPSAAHPSMNGWSGKGRDRADSARFAPKGVVGPEHGFDWHDDAPLAVPMSDSVIYEGHVKGLTQRFGGVSEELRGTYAALGQESMIGYLRDLGITALQLMSVHHHLDDDFLVGRNLVNYWGYNTIAFFAPESRYAATNDPVNEFKNMVKSLHAGGIEVILDVVYNHTGEGGPKGPLLSLRGLHNRGYYRTRNKYPDQYQDFTGCGNTLQVIYPQTLQLILDSLRYWVEEMHVDGFRFDLALTLAREPASFNAHSAFFKAIQQDAVLSRVKLIAEPWDVGRGGYQIGNFPPGWSELNGKFRDCVRKFWRGDGKVLGEFATRITGSEDLFFHNGRLPDASVNFVTSHDGFTLRDLVSYSHKHNEANGEDGRDGDFHNLSKNYGVEGPTEDPKIEKLRQRQVRNFFATMLLSQGVPFILAGDEIGRTQGGNNNAYCQDNEISWLDWGAAEDFSGLRSFVRDMIAFRKRHRVLRKRRFFSGQPIDGGQAADMAWFDPEGNPIDSEYWNADQPGAFAGVINENAADHRHNGERLSPSDSLLLIFNARRGEVHFQLPGAAGIVWELAVDTGVEQSFVVPGSWVEAGGETATLIGRSLQVWVLREGDYTRDQGGS